MGITAVWNSRTSGLTRRRSPIANSRTFIDRGGYNNSPHWGEFILKRRKLPEATKAAQCFDDRTGRPGPSTWELGSYPEGNGDHPVSGVDWFEAAAYCQSIGKSLPTVFHWRKAFGGKLLRRSLDTRQFLRAGTRGHGATITRKWDHSAPTAWQATSRNGCGTSPRADAGSSGGAWRAGLHGDVRRRADATRSRAETHGFRCIKESTPSVATAYAPHRAWSLPKRDLTKEKPVDATTFEAFRRFYSYDRTPLDPRIERTEEGEYWRRERVSFAAAYGGDRVLANILIPKNASPPYQAVIWFPGGYFAPASSPVSVRAGILLLTSTSCRGVAGCWSIRFTKAT